MKKILFVLFLVAVILVSGCVSPQKNKCNWEAGPCEKLISDGYYFDSVANQCKEVRGASGCLDPPFKNLVDCQTSCGGSVVAKAGGEDCRENTECKSGVCDFYKQDMGKCAPEQCSPGNKTNHNDFYCDQNGKWQRSKQVGSTCQNNYECFQKNCYEVPVCDITEKNTCKNSVCTSEKVKNECEPGKKKITEPAAFKVLEDGTCADSLEQKGFNKYCFPCGDGVCDKKNESVCNCPEDCEDIGKKINCGFAGCPPKVK